MNYLLQTSECNGFYNNPFKHGGKALRYTPWKTVALIPGDTPLPNVMEVFKAAHDRRDKTKLARYHVVLDGVTVIKPNGKVYVRKSDEYGTFIQCIGCVPGMEHEI